mmetsp:Transcript_57886/g.125701  ORF Transcript_57886/g.125701 Transcript_57886/m.125701 type:complete len:241 (-) Transcript_57886:391-1113(-)
MVSGSSKRNRAGHVESEKQGASTEKSTPLNKSVLSAILPPAIKSPLQRIAWTPQAPCVLSETGGVVSVAATLSQEECAAWIQYGEDRGFELQKHAQTRDTAHRDNGRIAIDSPEIAHGLWQRLQHAVPARIGRRDAVGCNPNIRLYKYGPGQCFGKHIDESNDLGCSQRTEMTVLVYLNDHGLLGGETIFYRHFGGELLRVRPECGMALLHTHGSRCLTHEGAAVKEGVKYVLRTDIVYK